MTSCMAFRTGTCHGGGRPVWEQEDRPGLTSGPAAGGGVCFQGRGWGAGKPWALSRGDQSGFSKRVLRHVSSRDSGVGTNVLGRFRAPEPGPSAPQKPGFTTVCGCASGGSHLADLWFPGGSWSGTLPSPGCHRCQRGTCPGFLLAFTFRVETRFLPQHVQDAIYRGHPGS